MGIINSSSQESQSRRLAIKTTHQQMKQLAIKGAGMSPWEADALIDIVDDVYFSNNTLRDIKEGQIKYSCISGKEGPGKPLNECEMVTVVLSLLEDSDSEDLSVAGNKQRQVHMRLRRSIRLCQEARDQDGLLTQEDLAKLLMCDVKTIQRDVKLLKENDICLPTRGQQKDIGPGITHRELIVRKWIEGSEIVEIGRETYHSVGAVENYIQKFKVIVYLRRERNFTDHEIAVVAGVSSRAVKVFIELYDRYKNKSTFKYRLEDIQITGKNYYVEVGEKKDLSPAKPSTQGCKRV